MPQQDAVNGSDPIDPSRPISSEQPDWERERVNGFWDPSRKLLRALRDYERWASRGGFLGTAMRRITNVRHRFWTIVTGAEIPLNTKIGGGLLIPHPNGIVIHPAATVGVNCLIFQQVTIGTRGGAAPRIAGHVDIGAGAKILGDVFIGAHARIGANAVVLDDVPAGAVAVGVPARVLLATEETE